MTEKKKEVKKGRHSRVLLSGISLLYVVNQIRKKLPYFTKAQKAGDPRLQPSGMTPLFNCGAFTLIELLVVVLIIGILAAVALPQYEKAVWKSRLAEVMINLKTIETCFTEYLLTSPSAGASLKEMGCSMELSGGSWDGTGDVYETQYFRYIQPSCGKTSCSFHMIRPDSSSPFFVLKGADKKCYTQNTSLGRMACKMFEDRGYAYNDSSD